MYLYAHTILGCITTIFIDANIIYYIYIYIYIYTYKMYI